MRVLLAPVLIAASAGPVHGECERMLGLGSPPVADLLLGRPAVTSLRYAPLPPDGSCRVGAELALSIPARTEVDWVDIVLTRHDPDGLAFEESLCAMVVDTRARSRVRLIPGQRYTATVAVYDVEGRKSEPVALELLAPGLGTREWMGKSHLCPAPAASPAVDDGLPDAGPRKPWSRVIVGVFGAAGFAWLMILLFGGFRRRDRR